MALFPVRIHATRFKEIRQRRRKYCSQHQSCSSLSSSDRQRRLPPASGEFTNICLSGSEHRILHWVRCIIREAYAVIDFEEVEEMDGELVVPDDPLGLGLAVLRIWVRFFKGNTQWQFVVNLGLSLEIFMKGLGGVVYSSESGQG